MSTLPMFAAADQADAALQAPESDPVAAWLAAPTDTPCDAVSAWLGERVAAVLPNYPADAATAYVVALHMHAVHATDDTYAALLAAEIAPERYDADAMYAGEIVDTADPGSWLAPSSSGTTDPGARTYKRADGTVRGHVDARVIGRDADGTHRAMPSRELLERAELWCMAQGATLPALIGSDSYSWAEVVTFTPATMTTVDGVTFTARPEGAGASLVGDGRKRRGHRARTAQYDPRPVEVDVLPWPRFLATGDRIVKRYATSLLVHRDDETSTRWQYVGNGPATRTITTRRRATLKPRGKVAQPVEVSTEQIADALLAAWNDPTMPNRYRVTRADGITVTVTVEHTARRYGVTVKNADGTTTRTKCRTLPATLKRCSI